MKYVFAVIGLCIFVSLAGAQVAPYLLLQGPSKRTTYRFQQGEVLEWQLKGDYELFRGKMVALYPESNAIRLGDLLISLDDVVAIRHAKKSIGFKNYLRIQGIANLGFLGIAYAADRNVRRDQGGFVAVAAAVSGAMIAYGSHGRYTTRKMGKRYVLSVAGGDLRRSDDPDRG